MEKSIKIISHCNYTKFNGFIGDLIIVFNQIKAIGKILFEDYINILELVL